MIRCTIDHIFYLKNAKKLIAGRDECNSEISKRICSSPNLHGAIAIDDHEHERYTGVTHFHEVITLIKLPVRFGKNNRPGRVQYFNVTKSHIKISNTASRHGLHFIPSEFPGESCRFKTISSHQLTTFRDSMVGRIDSQINPLSPLTKNKI